MKNILKKASSGKKSEGRLRAIRTNLKGVGTREAFRIGKVKHLRGTGSLFIARLGGRGIENKKELLRKKTGGEKSRTSNSFKT